jgi:hypothetical protein
MIAARARAADACVSREAATAGRPGDRIQEPDGYHQQAPEYHRGKGRNLALQTQLLKSLFQPSLECIRSLACFARIQLRIGLSSPFLKPQFLGSVIPIVDLLRQAILHRGLSLLDARHRPATNLAKVILHDVRDCVPLCLRLQLARNPCALWAGQYPGDIGLGRLKGGSPNTGRNADVGRAVASSST